MFVRLLYHATLWAVFCETPVLHACCGVLLDFFMCSYVHVQSGRCDSAATTRDWSRKGSEQTEAAGGVGARLEAAVRQGSSAEKPTLTAGPAAIPGILRFGGEQAIIGDGCGGAVAACRACGARGDTCGSSSADAEGERECGGRGGAVVAARLMRVASGE